MLNYQRVSQCPKDVVTYGAAIFCCEQSGQWRCAQQLLEVGGWGMVKIRGFMWLKQ